MSRTKCFSGVAFVLAHLMAVQVASAACDPPTVGGTTGVPVHSDTKAVDPGTEAHPVLLTSGSVLRLRMYATRKPGKKGEFEACEITDAEKANDEEIWTSAPALIEEDSKDILRRPYKEVSLVVTGEIGELKLVKGIYVLIVPEFVTSVDVKRMLKAALDAKADKTYVDRWGTTIYTSATAHSDQKDAAQDRRMDGLFYNGLTLVVAPTLFVTPGQDVQYGAMGRIGAAVGGAMDDTYLEIALAGGFAQGSIPTVGVVGVPHTETQATVTRAWVGPSLGASIGLSRHFSFFFGGSLSPVFVTTPAIAIGQETGGGSVYAIHATRQYTVLAAAEIAVRWFPGHRPEMGPFLSVALAPGKELFETQVSDGGVQTSSHGWFGLSFQVGGVL